MKKYLENNCNVRQLIPSEFDRVIDYFLKSDKNYLQTLGTDINKLPSKGDWYNFMATEYQKSFTEKKYFCLGWQYEQQLIGHSAMDNINYGQEARIHLHIWEPLMRNKGLGSRFLSLSIAYYFEQFALQRIICTPKATNTPPNKTLSKVGFEFLGPLETVPHPICFKQIVNQYILERNDFIKIQENSN